MCQAPCKSSVSTSPNVQTRMNVKDANTDSPLQSRFIRSPHAQTFVLPTSDNFVLIAQFLILLSSNGLLAPDCRGCLRWKVWPLP